MPAIYHIHCEPKQQDTRLLSITSPNANQFSSLSLADSLVNLQ